MVMTMVMISSMDSVSKSALKARMLEYFRKVEETGDELIVTDNNKPVLRIVPFVARTPSVALFADVRGAVTYDDEEDITSPTTGEWPES